MTRRLPRTPLEAGGSKRPQPVPIDLTPAEILVGGGGLSDGSASDDEASGPPARRPIEFSLPEFGAVGLEAAAAKRAAGRRDMPPKIIELERVDEPDEDAARASVAVVTPESAPPPPARAARDATRRARARAGTRSGARRTRARRSRR